MPLRKSSLWVPPGLEDDSTTGFNKQACIIAAGKWNGELCLLKNRDRNYIPKLHVVHIKDGDLELLYFEDKVTGWIEGLNSYSIGVVNTALMVGRDESEKKIVKTIGKKRVDGPRVKAALKCSNLEEALKALLEYKGGLLGHTFISDGEKVYSIEKTSRHEAVVREVPLDKIHVRTNHGFSYPDSGYTKGKNYLSSLARRNRAQRLLRKVETPKEIAQALTKASWRHPKDYKNTVRDTGKMYTSSQAILNLKDKSLNLYLIPKKVKFEGYTLDLPKKKKPELKLRVYRYNEEGDPIRIV